MQHILDYLFKQYLLHKEAGQLEETFIKWSKNLLQQNPPTSVFMAPTGLAIRLADGTDLVFNDQPEEEVVSESIEITKPKVGFGQNGVVPTKSIPIFGGPKK